MRIDCALLERGLVRSRTHAQNLIALNKITKNGALVKKASENVVDTDVLCIAEDADFESLGGLKLKEAISHFKINLTGLCAVDIGCSNGGFSAVLLDGGVKSLVAVDVGECCLPSRVINDKRCRFLRQNARNLKTEDVGEIDFVVADVSFISLKIVLPIIKNILCSEGSAICLIKPQFELGRAALSKSGIVNNKKLLAECVRNITDFASSIGFNVLDVIEALHPFEDKNQEYLMYLIV